MEIKKYNGHTIEIYNSIDEMPIIRFQKYNKYMLIDSGVGSDLQDILNHIDRAKIYVSANQSMALAEMNNLKQALYLVAEEMSPKYMAFAVLVYKIDGKVQNDLTDVGLKRVLEQLKEAKKGWLDGILDAVKKKIDKELSMYFPGRFEDGSIKEYYDLLKQHTQYMLKHIINGSDVRKECKDKEIQMALLSKPQVFSGTRSVEISYDKQFEEACLILGHNIQAQPDKMTVLQYYNAFDYLKKLSKQMKRK